MKYFLCLVFSVGILFARAQSLQDSVKIPNIFTPNLDGVNDVFKTDLSFESKVQSYSMEIFDRFGVSVFTTQKQGHYWDGRTTSGMPCTDGTYFYILQLTINSAKLEYKGFVQLFR